MPRLLLSSCFIAALSLSACGGGNSDSTKASSEVIIEDGQTRSFANEEERVADQMVNEMKTIVTALNGVTDEDSAKAAAKTMNDAGQRIQATLQEKGEELDGDRFKEAMAERQSEIEALQGEMERTIKRFMFKPKLAVILAEEMSMMDWSWMEMDINTDTTQSDP